MTDLFKEALARVLIHEGGKVDHPKDPGGRTNKGITQRVYNGWRTKNSLPLRDVYQIADMEVEAIYRFQYWEPIKADFLPPGVGYVVFDGAVNSGPRQSTKWLQRALGPSAGAVDGVVGSVTLTAAQQDHDHDALIARICERRMAFLQALKTWPTFKRGWTRRVNDVRATGQAWAMGSVGPEVTYIPGGEAKATIADAKKPPSKAPGDIGMGVGGAGSVGGGTLDQMLNGAREQLEPYAAFGWVKNVIVWLVVAGILVAAASFAYRWWADREAKKLADALDMETAK